jgi:hypothetical protein
MTGKVDIANAALRAIGASRITAFDDGTKNADVVDDLYDSLRDQLLYDHYWNFAIPGDWLRTISVHDTSDGIGSVEYKAEAGFVLSDANHIWMRYVYRVTDVNQMPLGFQQALTSALARDLALPITDSGTMFDRLSKQADADLLYARSKDGMEGTPEPRPWGSWTAVRFGSRNTRNNWPK